MKYYALGGLLVATIVIVIISVCAFRHKSQTLKTEKFFSSSMCRGGITVATTTFDGKRTYAQKLSCLKEFWPNKNPIAGNVVRLGFSAIQKELQTYEVRFYNGKGDADIAWSSSKGSIQEKQIPKNATHYAIKLQSISKPTCSTGSYTYTHAGKTDETGCFPPINVKVVLPRSITSFTYYVPKGFFVHLFKTEKDKKETELAGFGHTTEPFKLSKDWLQTNQITHFYIRKP
jgi:hypothetical protein